MTDEYFSEAFEPWIPRLIDIEKRKADGDPDYTDIGFDGLVVDPSMTNLASRMTTLKTRFDERYYNRMINAETLPRWQIRLQNRFDEIAAIYDRAYAIYAQYAQDMQDDALEGWKEDIKSTDSGDEVLTKSGSESLAYSGKEKTTEGGTDESKKLTNDTPDSAINASASYANAAEHGTTDYGHTSELEFTNRNDTRSFTDRKDTKDFGKVVDVHKEHIITGGDLTLNVNRTIRNWMDLDTEFVKEFENLFLNIFWY